VFVADHKVLADPGCQTFPDTLCAPYKKPKVSTPQFWDRRVDSLVEVTRVGLRYAPGQSFFTCRLKVWPN
jgi:hypothetical protein